MYSKEDYINFAIEQVAKTKVKSDYSIEVALYPSPETFQRVLGLTAIQAKELGMAGITIPSTKTVTIFVGEIVEKVVAYVSQLPKVILWVLGGIDNLIKKSIVVTIIHECRHSNQFMFIQEHGLNLDSILFEENSHQYGTGKLEMDANLAVCGIRIPFSFLFRKELKKKK